MPQSGARQEAENGNGAPAYRRLPWHCVACPQPGELLAPKICTRASRGPQTVCHTSSLRAAKASAHTVPQGLFGIQGKVKIPLPGANALAQAAQTYGFAHGKIGGQGYFNRFEFSL